MEEASKGTVKEVLSGDTLILWIQRGPNQEPAQQQITLSRLQAPQMGRGKSRAREANSDQPFAWDSREFLRSLVIGKPVTFRVLPSKKQAEGQSGGRQFAQVQFQGQDLASMIVAEGWASVNAPPGGARENNDLQALLQLEQQAREQEKGIFSKAEGTVRPTEDPDMSQWKDGTKVKAVLERVQSGSSLRFTVLPSLHNVQVQLAGVTCPEFPQQQDSEERQPEPFAREAKFFVEFYVLNRVCELTIRGRMRFGLIASASFAGKDVGIELLHSGLAKVSPFASSMDGEAFQELQDAENAAKSKQVRIWTGYVPDQSREQVALGNQFTGTVIQVLTSGSLVVEDPRGALRTVFLSSIRTPSAGNPRESYEPTDDAMKKYDKATLNKLRTERAWALQGKEAVRKAVIGKKVTVRLDYLRKHQQDGDQRAHCTITQDRTNLAVMLVSRGLANVVSHRGDDPRSPFYSDLLEAEEAAKKKKVGVHGSADRAPPLRNNDLTLPNTTQKAKQFLPFLERAGKCNAIVEHVFNAGRFKLTIPKDSVTIFFSLSAVRPPSRDHDPNLFAQGTKFAVAKFMQRQVEIEVEAVDKNGGFIGKMTSGRFNVAEQLLEQGLVEVFGPAADRASYGPAYRQAEKDAKEKRRGMWLNYDPEEEARKSEERKKAQDEKYAPKSEVYNVVVSEIVDGCTFYIQIDGPETEQLLELMRDLQVNEGGPVNPTRGQLVQARFSDGQYYRAEIKDVKGNEALVFFIDYGNTAPVALSDLRQLLPNQRTLPAQAHEAKLAYVITPDLEDEFGVAAAVFLRDATMDRRLVANVEYREGKTAFVSLGDPETKEYVNGAIVAAGLGRIPRAIPRGNPYVTKLRDQEKKARTERLNLWQYGEATFGDDDDPLAP